MRCETDIGPKCDMDVYSAASENMIIHQVVCTWWGSASSPGACKQVGGDVCIHRLVAQSLEKYLVPKVPSVCMKQLISSLELCQAERQHDM